MSTSARDGTTTTTAGVLACLLCNGTRYVCARCGEASNECSCPEAKPGEAADREPCTACMDDLIDRVAAQAGVAPTPRRVSQADQPDPMIAADWPTPTGELLPKAGAAIGGRCAKPGTATPSTTCTPPTPPSPRSPQAASAGREHVHLTHCACTCGPVSIPMPHGSEIEVRSCRVKQLWAPLMVDRVKGAADGDPQSEARVECYVELVDGSLIACTRTPHALLGRPPG